MIDFIGIGTQRSGTTFISNNLRYHHKIALLDREANFFSNGIYKYSIEEYWKNWDREFGGLKGEKSPSYCLMRPFEIRRMKKILPNVKLILILRNPVERMWSGLNRDYTFSYMNGASVSPNKRYTRRFITDKINIEFGRYDKILRRFKRYYGENMFIDFHERIKSDFTSFNSDLCRFLNIEVVSHDSQKIKKHQSRVDAYRYEEFNYFLHRIYVRSLINIRFLNSHIVDGWIKESEQYLESHKEYKWSFYKLYFWYYLPKRLLKDISEPFRFVVKTMSFHFINRKGVH